MNPQIAYDPGPAILRKLRWRLIPLLFLLYVVAYLDRINISFAALTMNAALGITSRQFGLLLGIFFWGYFLFEVPSNLLLHKTGARVWIARILITWGIVAAVTGAVQNVQQVYIARFVLGITEAGFFPGMILYLTYWFPRREQAKVIALFAMALPISNIIGAPVSGFILDHAHWAGLASWRWLLILEGIPAILCGALALVALPSRPADGAFLNDSERAWIADQLHRDLREGKNQEMSVLRTLAHPRVWKLAAVLFGFDIGLYAMTFYMPRAMKSILAGNSNTRVGVLVLVPHLIGLISMVLVSRSSDKKLERRFHCGIPLACGGLALILLFVTQTSAFSIALWCLAAMGLYSFFGPFFAMPSGFLEGYAAASGIALINSVGNLGGFVGPSVVGAMAGGRNGIYGGLAFAGVTLIASAALVVIRNKRVHESL